MEAQLCMKDLVAFCKRKGFIFLSSDIYGGLNGFFDYGPLGVELKRNIKAAWWNSMVHEREDVVGLDSSIILHPNVWKASGHVDGFSDPMVDCKVTKMRYRADQVFYSPVSINGEVVGYICVTDGEERDAEVEKKVKALLKSVQRAGEHIDALQLKPLTEAKPEEYALIPSPATDKPGDLTPPRDFNLMFQTQVGAVASESSVAYLRPETAQGIFIHFKNVVDSTRVKVPFGIAQIGKAFRNEITPRNFIFRSREFEQMEMEYFCPADEESWPELHKKWIETRYNWHCSIGIKKEWLSFDVHKKEDLAHYAKACTDIMFKYPFDVQELEGIAVRGNFDLTQHQKFSGKPLEYFDEEFFIKVFQRFSAKLLMLRQIEVSTDRNTFQLLHIKRIFEHNVRASFRVVRQVLFLVHIKAQPFLFDADRAVPIVARFNPLFMQLRPGFLIRRAEIFHLHLLKFSRTENEVTRCDFIAKRFTDLGNSEGHLHACRIHNIFEMNENSLRCFRTQISHARFRSNRTHLCLEHQIKVSRRC